MEPNFNDLSSLNPDDIVLFQPIREAARDVLQIIAPNANVYPYWELEFDHGTLQRKVTPLLKGKNSDAGIYHAWMLGITAAPTLRGSDGQEEFVGNFAFSWMLTLEFEGFFDLRTDDPWGVAEKEMIMATMIFHFNMHRILKNVKYHTPSWSMIDLEAFADGHTLINVQGSSQVEVEQSIPIAG